MQNARGQPGSTAATCAALAFSSVDSERRDVVVAGHHVQQLDRQAPTRRVTAFWKNSKTACLPW